ncbi:MAG TPA: flagellar hook-associated protein FlgK [Solirubrobacteraceae bacterium]|nr:flagellar hook-associated protein FlgK [Solirubrobacteraceae bacterium]
MTIPTYMGLNTALSGLEAAQAAIDTTGQNIANADTPGYSRQRVNMTERSQLTIPALSSYTGDGSQFGTGVDITSITRIRDTFLDSQYRAQNTTENGENTTSTILSQVQAGLNEPTADGLSGALDQFFTDWNTLSSNPTDQGAQQAVMGDGSAVADQLNTMSGQLSTLESQVTDQYNTLTDPTNGAIANDANQIAQLNTQIAQAQAAGIDANALEDQRDNVIDDLSQYSSVNVTTQSNGMVNVSLGNAAIAAQNGTADSTPLVNGSTVDLTDNLTDANISGAGGTLGALLGLHDATTGTGQIDTYMATLNTVANQLVTTVNGAISGADSSGPTATPFFDPTGTTAATIAVNPSLTSNGTTPPYTATEANAVAALSGGTADQSYKAFVTQVGSDVQSAQNAQQTSQSLLTAIGNQRQSISGVSLDEEMTNLIQFQQAYQASARVMSTINDTIGTLLSMVSSG